MPKLHIDEDGELLDIEQTLKEILTPLIADVRKQLLTQVTQEVESRFKQQQEAPTQPEVESDNPTVKALTERLKMLEEKDLEQQKQAAEAKRTSYLAEIVQKHGTDVPDLAMLAVNKRLGDLVEHEGKYLCRDGKDPVAVVDEFFKTPEGMRLLPSNLKPGSGNLGGQAPRVRGNKEATTDELIMKAFGGI